MKAFANDILCAATYVVLAVVFQDTREGHEFVYLNKLDQLIHGFLQWRDSIMRFIDQQLRNLIGQHRLDVV